MVMAQSLFIALKEKNPRAQIDVLSPGWTQPLLDRMPEVRDGLVMPLGHGQFGLKQRFALGKTLRDKAYDQAIVLPGSWKSALVPYFAQIPKRTGFRGEMRFRLLNDIRPLNKKLLTQTVQRFVALSSETPVFSAPKIERPMLQVSDEQRNQSLQTFKLSFSDESPILALCPGAEYGPAKRWPAKYFAEVANKKIADGWQVWIFGSSKDASIAEDINRQAGNNCIDLTGRTSLGEAIDLMSLAHTVVTNDSGLMHVAASLQRRIIAIYGSSDPGFTPPLTDNAKILSLGISCSPCFERDCPLGHTRCLYDLTPDMVLAALS